MKFTRDQTISLCNFFIQKKFLKKCSNLILSLFLIFRFSSWLPVTFYSNHIRVTITAGMKVQIVFFCSLLFRIHKIICTCICPSFHPKILLVLIIKPRIFIFKSNKRKGWWDWKSDKTEKSKSIIRFTMLLVFLCFCFFYESFF